MASAKYTLFDARGQVLRVRSGISPALVDSYVNKRIRQVMCMRTYWSDLILKGVLAVPNAWSQGTASVTPGSAIVSGVGTNWPINDVVSTVLPDGIFETGNQEVFPASMQGISESSILMVDVEGYMEIVAVNKVTPTSFWAVFMYPHNQLCSAQMSSLAGRQFRLGSESPIFDVLAIQDPQTAIINLPWGGVPLSNQQYNMPLMYYTIAPNIRKFCSVVDRQQGIPILTSVNIENVNWQDPQRTASGDPEVLADIGSSRNGLSLYELWPTQLSARQIDWIIYVDWPELSNDTDRLPWFWNPDVIINGVMADAFRYRRSKEDYLFNPQLAREYEAMFEKGVQGLINADESKMQQDLSAPSPLGFGGGPGTLYYQSHTGTGWGSDWANEI